VRIAIDIDSTLHHYWGQLEEVVRAKFGVELPYDAQTVWEIEALHPEQLREAVRETHSERWVMAGEPYPGAVEAVRRWHEAGHFIHITSHRAVTAADVTEEWLRRIGLPYDELYCSYDKVTRCAEIGIDVLVDDSPVNLVRAREAGIHGATLLHPWNRDVCERHGFICAESWPELETAIAALAEAGSQP
jgi:FMN phosphatase YigB (HAD superfamily)